MARFILILSLLLILPLGALAGDDAQGTFDARLERLDALSGPDLAAEAYRLGLEIQAAGHENLATKAFRRVLEADPEHRAARRALGYEQVAGRWLRGDDLWRARGFVHHEGQWMTALEFAEATRPEREAARADQVTDVLDEHQIERIHVHALDGLPH